MLGAFITERKLRDQIVVATKSGFVAGQGATVPGLATAPFMALITSIANGLR
jgi:aryl-alcohol dehydrogenase-like predicted oxidoreductase